MIVINEVTIELWMRDKGSKGIFDWERAITDFCFREGLGDMRPVLSEKFRAETADEQPDSLSRIGMRCRLMRGVRIEECMNEGFNLGRKVFGDDDYQKMILGEKSLIDLAKKRGLDLKSVKL